MFKPNTLFYSDGYKVGHKRMLAPNTDFLYGTWIPRSLKYIDQSITQVVSFGQQLTVRWLHDEFKENFFDLPLDEAMKFGEDMSLYLGSKYDANHFKALHELGYLPIKIKSLPEGIKTNANIPHMTFINTVRGFAWLTLYLETIISSLSWKSSTSATLALEFKERAKEWVMKTDPENAWFIDFACHDFSARGLDPFSMLASGLGHATSHRGSDTLVVIPGARYFYNEPDDEVCINSVNASEHSVSTTKIFTVGEKQMIIDWCKEFPVGVLSIVADTFDLWKLITEYLTDPEVKDAILSRDGKLVIRPDSGDPVDIICGETNRYEDISKYFPEGEVIGEYFSEYLLEEVRENTLHGKRGVSEHTSLYKVRGAYYKATIDNISWNRYDKQYYFIDMYESPNVLLEEITLNSKDKGVIELLWDIFGGTTNEQGYKVLDSHIGAIYGDSINLDRQTQIYSRLADKGFASTNIVLGIGSFTYQFNTRDTLGYAAKGAWFEANGIGYNIYKDPITDDGTKKSLKGMCSVFRNNDGEFYVEQEQSKDGENKGELTVIYENGEFYNQASLSDIRNNLNNN